jgi:hypothetical protein
MRALCGAIIAAGALIGLGLAAIGVGTRYQQFPRTEGGNPAWVYFHQMDTALIVIVVLLICTLIVGVALAILGLAYHHHRRYHELFGSRGTSVTEPRQPVG